VFANNSNHLYVPWSVEDAIDKLKKMQVAIDNVYLDEYNIGKISDYQNGTIDRTLDCMYTGSLTQPLYRDSITYRKHVAKAKYE